MSSKAQKGFNYVASIVVAYWVVSISMVYLNKVRQPTCGQKGSRARGSLCSVCALVQVLMTNKDFSIPAPLFVTWFQCFFTCVLCYICGELGEIQRKKGKAGGFFSQFPPMQYNAAIAYKVSALSVVRRLGRRLQGTL
jgi:solute carrier family 35 (GDP-fucose transporter), member C1